MARSAVTPGVFTGKQGQQGVNRLVVFAAVVGAVFVAGLPFISKEVAPALCLSTKCTVHRRLRPVLTTSGLREPGALQVRRREQNVHTMRDDVMDAKDAARNARLSTK